MSSPIYKIKLDCQHVRRKFNIYTHVGDTPIIRAWLYQDGERYTPAEDWTAQLAYGENYEFSTALVKVDGDSGYSQDSSSSSEDGDADYNYFDFEFEAGDIGTPGDYFCQVIIRNALDTERYVFGDGTLHVLDSPIGGSHTDLVLTETVNWDIIDNVGTVPWSDSTEVIAVSDCSSPSTTCSADDTGKTWVWTGACNQTFYLPTVAESSVGAIFKFLNLTGYKITIRPQLGTLLDGYPAIYSGAGGVNDNPHYTYIRVKQTTDTSYNAIEGRLKWTYLNV